MIYWIIHIVILGSISMLFYQRFNAGFPLWIYLSGLILKLTAGISLGLIFYHYYQRGDTIVFFEEAKRVSELPFKEYFSTVFSPSNYTTSSHPRVLFFIKFLSFFTLITGNSYWISSLYLSIISFFSSWYFVISISRLFPSKKAVITFSFLFIPTIIFWSSGILKDTLAFSALLFMICTVLKIYANEKMKLLEWILSIISIFLLLKIKHYLLISFILFIGLLIFMKFITKSFKHKLIACIVVIGAIVSTQFVHPYLRFERLALTVHETNQTILKKSDEENRLNISIDSPTINDILKAVPSAIQIGLFRPAIFDRSTIWGWFHRIENSILTLLFVLSILLYFKLKPDIDWPLISSSIIAILILSTLLALATPNFGTLVRYKNAFLPFFFLLCSILPYKYFTEKTIT